MNTTANEAESRQASLHSNDGTAIAYKTWGNGPRLLLINGALSFRRSKGVYELVQALSPHFTVISYDRRGRGDSGDTKPYQVEKEIEDIAALIEQLGGNAFLFGVSSGAALALLATAQLGPEKVVKAALYEPPFGFNSVKGQKGYDAEKENIRRLVAAGQVEDAVVAFFQSLNVPPEQLDAMKQSPDWNVMVSVGHTLVYDFEILSDGGIPLAAARKLQVPTLVLDGANSFAFMHAAADQLAATIPDATRKTLRNQTHELSPEIIAPILTEYFLASGSCSDRGSSEP